MLALSMSFMNGLFDYRPLRAFCDVSLHFENQTQIPEYYLNK